MMLSVEEMLLLGVDIGVVVVVLLLLVVVVVVVIVVFVVAVVVVAVVVVVVVIVVVVGGSETLPEALLGWWGQVAVRRSNASVAIAKTKRASVSPARGERDIDFD